MAAQYSDDAQVRVSQIVGRPAVSEEEAERNRKLGRGPRRARPAIPGILNMGRSTFLARVQSGEFPKPAKVLGPAISTWRYEWVRRLSEQTMGASNDNNARSFSAGSQP